MKRKLSLWDKLIIFRMWMLEYADDALISSCSICKSPKIKRLEFGERNGVYRAKYECMKCKATADVVENWYLPKANDPTE